MILERKEEEAKHHGRVDGEYFVFAHQEGHRTFANVSRDQVHRVRAFRECLHAEVEEARDDDAYNARCERRHRQLLDQFAVHLESILFRSNAIPRNRSLGCCWTLRDGSSRVK